MAWTKPELKCDLCEQPIDGELPYPTVALPLDSGDRERIISEVQKQMPPHVKLVFGGLAAAGMIPKSWKLEICEACITKAFPTANFIKTNQIIQALERRAALTKKHTVQALDDDDD